MASPSCSSSLWLPEMHLLQSNQEHSKRKREVALKTQRVANLSKALKILMLSLSNRQQHRLRAALSLRASVRHQLILSSQMRKKPRTQKKSTSLTRTQKKSTKKVAPRSTSLQSRFRTTFDVCGAKSSSFLASYMVDSRSQRHSRLTLWATSSSSKPR